MKMLSNLTIKDYLDFGGGVNSDVGVAPVDVVISGVGIILPLMNEEILKVSTLIDRVHIVIRVHPCIKDTM